MNLRNLCAAAVASCLVASGASAITMTVTQTGTLDFIEYENFDYFDNPPASHLAKIGDVGTVTYDIDLDQLGAAGAPNWSSTGWTSSEATNYVSGDAMLTLGGVTHNMGAMTVQVGESYEAGLPPRYRQWIDITNANMQYYNFFPTTFAPQSTSLLDLVKRGEPVTDDILYLYLPSDLIGAAAGDCDAANGCFMPLVNVSTTVTLSEPLPVDPVAAVPVPAPFLMLGMAMLGLIGFGRRSAA